MPSCDIDAAAFKLQDIGIAEDPPSQGTAQPLPSQPKKADPADHQFLDYTELDAIPFSQFELTEDFLSGASQSVSSSSQSRGRRKSLSALVQRKSPRLSSFLFNCSDKSALDSGLSCRRTSPQSNFFRVVRKQKKTKKALLLSSLFQYLIDEAKRDTSFLEFKLPDDIAEFVSLSSKVGKEKLSDSGETSSTHSDSDFLDLQAIPETEVDPDFVSQKSCGADFEVKCGNSQMAEQHELQAALCVRTDPQTPTLPPVNQPAAAVDLSLVSNSSKRNSSFGSGGETEFLKKAKVNEALPSSDSSSVSPSQTSKTLPPSQSARTVIPSQTGSTKARAPAKTASHRTSLSLKVKGRRPQEKDLARETISASDNCKRSVKMGQAHGTDTALTGLVHSPAGERNGSSTVDLTKSPDQSLTVLNLPPTPKATQQPADTDTCSYPLHFGTQSQSSVVSESTTHHQVSQADHHCVDQADCRWRQDFVKPVFTPSKSKCCDGHREGDSRSWIRYAGCAEVNILTSIFLCCFKFK